MLSPTAVPYKLRTAQNCFVVWKALFNPPTSNKCNEVSWTPRDTVIANESNFKLSHLFVYLGNIIPADIDIFNSAGNCW